jgi:hypothetical protein
MLGNLLYILANHGKVEDCLRVFSRLKDGKDVTGLPSIASIEACLEKICKEKATSPDADLQSATVRAPHISCLLK